MGIGGALAEARTEAGLTITQVSERTRIRETIIRDIERDDYSACGGDYYARGHIRAIARVVGTDPAPLIEEYDTIHNPPPEPPPDAPPPPAGGSGWRERWSHWLTGDDPGGGLTKINGRDPGAAAAFPADADTDPSLYDAVAEGLSARSPSGAATMESVAGWAASARARVSRPDPADAEATVAVRAPAGRPATTAEPASIAEPASDGDATIGVNLGDATIASAPADDPPWLREPFANGLFDEDEADSGLRGGGVPGGITAAEAFRPALPMQRRRQLSGRGKIIILAVLIALGLLIYFLVAGGSPKPAAGHSRTGHASGSSGTAGNGSPAGHGSTTGASASPPASHPPATAVAALSPVRAAAFGPGGFAHGDNPGQARLAIDRSARTSWHSDWYATANLGNLQSGTGLLLTMRQPVRVSVARLTLAPQAGGTVQLRAGNSPVLAALPVIARSADTGGTVTLRVAHPVSARYVLIWFTSLPPDGSGTYQAKVFTIALSGTS